MLTLGAFIVAIAFLVAFHEWGPFAMARACGVKVLCFSIGFGPKLLSWTSPATGTEYRLAALPLGGFVRMLDEREAPVPANLLSQAFNTQALFKRALIVAAGPRRYEPKVLLPPPNSARNSLMTGRPDCTSTPSIAPRRRGRCTQHFLLMMGIAVNKNSP